MDLQSVEKERIKYMHSYLKTLYSEAGADRRKLSNYELSNTNSTAILGEIECASSDIAGCATQIFREHPISNVAELLHALDRADIFKLGHIQQWYFENFSDYKALKLYVDINDYLRLLIVEYFRKYARADSDSAE